MKTERPLFFNKNLLIIYSVTMIAVMGVASIAPALPKIMGFYEITAQHVGLLIVVFTFPGIILTPLAGILADRMGRKKILVPSLVLFSLAGTSCAFVNNFNLLLMMRFIQGIGAAAIGSMNVTLIGDIFHGKQRGEAMGYNASVLSIGTASYPAIGGLLATIGWNYPFILTVLALPVGLLVLYSLENTEPQKNDNFKKYFKSAWIDIRKKDVLAIYTVSFLIFIVLYGSILTYTPILLKQKFNSPSYMIGLLLSVMSIAMGISATQIGKISKIWSPAKILVIAASLYIVSMLLMPLMPSTYLLIIPLLAFGFGNGMLMPTLQTVLAGKAPLEQRGIFMSFNGMVLRMGQTVGPMITGVAFIFGIQWAFWMSIVVALVMIGMSRFIK